MLYGIPWAGAARRGKGKTESERSFRRGHMPQASPRQQGNPPDAESTEQEGCKLQAGMK